MKSWKLYSLLYLRNKKFPLGSRVSREQLVYYGLSESIIEEALKKLYIECPSGLPGDDIRNKHYLLRKPWQLVNLWTTMMKSCIRNPFKTPVYLWWFIISLLEFGDLWKYYMGYEK